MSNPYAAPSQSTDADVHAAARLTSKPLRIWIFQALLALQLAGAVAMIASAVLASEVGTLPPSAILFGLIRPIVGIPVVACLLVALQRLGPKPRLAAPVLASLWWLLSISAHFVLGVPPEPDALRALTFDDAPSPPPWVTGILLHAGLLWFVVSTWLHHGTRAYLSREAALKR